MLLAQKQNKSVIAGRSISLKSSKEVHILATTWDFQQCGKCDKQRLRSAWAYAQSDQSLEYSMAGNLLNEQHLVSFLKRRVHRLTCAYTPASNLGYLAPPPGQFFMGAKLFIGTPWMGNEGVLKKILVWAM